MIGDVSLPELKVRREDLSIRELQRQLPASAAPPLVARPRVDLLPAYPGRSEGCLCVRPQSVRSHQRPHHIVSIADRRYRPMRRRFRFGSLSQSRSGLRVSGA
jgi:hypothetical protein